jgi:uncharacterized protein DUF4129
VRHVSAFGDASRSSQGFGTAQFRPCVYGYGWAPARLVDLLYCRRNPDSRDRKDGTSFVAEALNGVAAGTSRKPLLLLEEAVHLLRRAPAGIWASHLAGSAPFALGLLFFWNAVTNPRMSSGDMAAASLGMALLLVWMSCCRAVFAMRLRNLVSGSQNPAWTLAQLGSLISRQCILASTKLIALPFGVLILFPLANLVAFYRYAAVVEHGKARKLAGIGQGQSWTILLLLQFLGLVVLINVGIALAVLPHLVRKLTGYESSFTRSGVFYILNPLFGLVVMAVTWIIFDPFVQAVYTLRSFHLESLETGEDLRVALRRIRAALTHAAAAWILLLPAAIPSASAAIPREQLEQSIQEAMRAPEYDWRLPPKPAESGKSWLVEMVDRVIAQFRSFGASISEAIDRAIRWLMKQLGGKMPEPAGGAPPRALHGGIYVAIAVTAAVVAILVWRALRRRAAKPQPLATDSAAATPLDAEELSPDRLPEEQWISLAEQCLREENFRLALRALYLANLAWLGRREFLTLHAGKTNREYEAELRRRGRAIPEAHSLFAMNIAVFERAWYGTRAVSAGDIGEFRSRIDQMKRLEAA